MASSNDLNKKDLPSEHLNNLPSEVRRTLLKAAWVTPMLTVVSIPVHAQTSATTTPEPNLEFDEIEFKFLAAGNNSQVPVAGKYTGKIIEAAAKASGLDRTKADVDFTGWTVKIKVKVTRQDGGTTDSATLTFTVPVAADGSFELELAVNAFWADACGGDGGDVFIFISADATATLLNPNGEERDTMTLFSEYDNQDDDPARYTLVGGPCSTTTPTPTTTSD